MLMQVHEESRCIDVESHETLSRLYIKDYIKNTINKYNASCIR